MKPNLDLEARAKECDFWEKSIEPLKGLKHEEEYKKMFLEMHAMGCGKHGETLRNIRPETSSQMQARAKSERNMVTAIRVNGGQVKPEFEPLITTGEYDE